MMKKEKKAIIGIAMAAIMLASVFVAMVPTVSAVSIGDNFNYVGADPAVTYTVLVGQNVQFNGSTDGVPYWTDPENVRVQRFDSPSWYDYRGPWPDGTAYNVAWDTTLTLRATDGTTNVSLSVQEPNVPLTLKVGEKAVTSIAAGTPLRVDTGGINLFALDKVDLLIYGPDGKMTVNPANTTQGFANIPVSNLTRYGSTDTTLQIDTTGWKIGSYTFQVKTKPEYACGLAAESAVKSLTIAKEEIAISAEKTTVAELETVKLTVTGVAGRNITVRAYPMSANVIFSTGIEDNPTTANWSWVFHHTIGADGTRTYSVYFTDTGSYTIKVIDFGPNGAFNGTYVNDRPGTAGGDD
ncbi:MAG: hypothetical protein IBX41_09230, partial [Methanophagales archaeon]|nr:hypothetical protein [Methanophagales archaeon]